MTTEIDVSHPKILVYGEPGVGKTTWACGGLEYAGHPQLDNIMLLNVDAGTMALAPFKKKPLIRTIGNKMALTKSDLIKRCEEEIWKAHGGKNEYEGIRTIVLDSVSELQNRDLEDMTAGKDDVERDDYRRSTNRLRRVLRLLRDVPFTVIVTALPKSQSDSSGNVIRVYPALSKAAAESINGFMDAVWYAYRDSSKGNEFALLTKKKGATYAKGRGPLDKFPEILRGTSLAEVYDTIQKTV